MTIPNVSLGTDVLKHGLKVIPFETVIEKVRSSNILKQKTDMIRVATDEDAQAKLKKKLPFISTSIFKDGIRRTDNFIEAHLIHFDLDHLDGNLETIKSKLAQDPLVHAFWTSPRGAGLKVYYRLAESITDISTFAATWGSRAHQIKQTYGVDPDTACQDTARACFLSYDPQAYYNEAAEAIPVMQAEPGAKQDKPPISDLYDGIKPGDSRNNTIRKLCIHWFAKGEIFPEVLELAKSWNSQLNNPLSESVVLYNVKSAQKFYDKTHRPRPEETAPKKMTFVTLDALLLEPPEIVKWLVDGLFPAGGFSLVSAKPKVAKSTLARQLALAVAQGDLFLGRETQKGAVIYCVFEEKRSEVADHFRAMGAEDEKNIYFFFDVAPENLVSQIREKIAEVNPVLIVLDTLFKAVRVKDLNDYAQTIAALEPLLDIARKSGVHVMGLHHEKKTYTDDAGSRILGSTGIYAQFDTILSISRNPADNKRTIQSVQRYGDDLPPSILVFDKITRVSTIGGSVAEIKLHDLRGEVLHFLASCEDGITEKDIHENTEGRKELKVKIIRELLRDGDIFRTGEGKKKNPYLYFINELKQDYKTDAKKVVPEVPEHKSSTIPPQENAGIVVPGTPINRGNHHFSLDTSNNRNTGSVVSVGDQKISRLEKLTFEVLFDDLSSG